MENNFQLPVLAETERTQLANLTLFNELRTPENVAGLFFVPAYKVIAEELVAIHADGQDGERFDAPGTSRAVVSRLEAKGLLEAAGGRDAVVSLLEIGAKPDVDPSFGGGQHIGTLERLRDVARRRRIMLAARRLEEAACNPATPAERVEVLRSQLAEAAETSRRSLDVPKDGFMRECLERINDMIRRKSFVTGIRSGWDAMDDMLGGLRESTFTVLGARPSMGKTAFGLCLAAAVASLLPEGAGEVVFVTAEMGVPQLMERMLANMADVELRRAVKRGMKKGELVELNRAAKRLRELPLQFVDANGVDLDELAAHVKRRHRERKIALLVVDYLQLLRCSRMEEQGRYAVVSEVSRVLTSLAHMLGIPVFALAQLSRESAKAKDKTPGLTNLRESGAIEQDADAVLLLHRPDYYEAPKDAPNNEPEVRVTREQHLAKVIVAKNREGATGCIFFDWLPDVQRFTPHVEPGSREGENNIPF